VNIHHSTCEGCNDVQVKCGLVKTKGGEYSGSREEERKEPCGVPPKYFSTSSKECNSMEQTRGSPREKKAISTL